jgi:NAD-dependent SIR2 family protein deacetylase
VLPAANLIPYARTGGAKVIEINTEDTAASTVVDCALRGPAGELLPRLL